MIFRKKNNKTEAQKSKPTAAQIARGMFSAQDIIAPPSIEVDFSHLQVGEVYYRTLFVAGYPRFVNANWLSPLINFDHTLEIAMYIYPTESKDVLADLRRKIGEMEATISTDVQRGKVVDPTVQATLQDAHALQEQLAKGAERFFQFGLYITIPAHSIEELDSVTKEVESTLASLLIVAKRTTLQMEDGFRSTLPLARDRLFVIRNMDTTSLASTFPFTSSELSSDQGIMYGINEHNGSLIVFDRFSLENANAVVLSKSGAGKSYLTKLEAVRSLMFGTEIIVIDPEDEYRTLCAAVGGEHIPFQYNAPVKMNPLDLSGVYIEGENELGVKIQTLHRLLRVMLGNLTPTEDAILDRALVATYQQKGITADPKTQRNTPPLMEDVYKVLVGMEETQARGIADRLERYVKGSLAGFFSSQSTVSLKNKFTVFSIRELEEELRPIAMFMVLDYIWTRVRQDMKRRILIVDEAWYMMRYPDSAMFLWSIAKRSRKYYLGLTTITQDIDDFLASELGTAIIQNSSIQILLRQSPQAIEKLTKAFALSEGEKHLLLSADVGEGLFFAGPNHAAMRVVASADEHKLITSKPQELLEMQQQQPKQQ